MVISKLNETSELDVKYRRYLVNYMKMIDDDPELIRMMKKIIAMKEGH
jgi:hypothetical protein